MLEQVSRVLRPGGLFLACEWGRFVSMHGGLDPLQAAPRSCEFFAAVSAALEQRGIVPVAQNLVAWLRESGHFERVKPRMFCVPIGNWPDEAHMRGLGVAFRDVMFTYAESMRVVLVEGGMHVVQADALVNGYQHEMNTVRNMVGVYYTVHARVRA
jgi:hypothetical protein